MSEVLPPFPRRPPQAAPRLVQPPPPTPPPATPSPVVTRSPVVEKKGFGIDDAIKLLRRLRERDNVIVREAVQQTLEFLDIDVARVIESANAREAQLGSNIDRLKVEIERHEALMLAAKKQIAAHETERAELGVARSWLLAKQREALAEPIPLVRIVR